MTEADFAVIDSMLQSSVNKIAELKEELAVAKSAAESWAATAIAGEARERTAKEELARVKAEWRETEMEMQHSAGRNAEVLALIADLRAQLQAAEAERDMPWRDIGLALRSLLLLISKEGINPEADWVSGDAAARRLISSDKKIDFTTTTGPRSPLTPNALAPTGYQEPPPPKS